MQGLPQPVSGAAEKIRCTVVLLDGELSDETGVSFGRTDCGVMTTHDSIQLPNERRA